MGIPAAAPILNLTLLWSSFKLCQRRWTLYCISKTMWTWHLLRLNCFWSGTDFKRLRCLYRGIGPSLQECFCLWLNGTSMFRRNVFLNGIYWEGFSKGVLLPSCPACGFSRDISLSFPAASPWSGKSMLDEMALLGLIQQTSKPSPHAGSGTWEKPSLPCVALTSPHCCLFGADLVTMSHSRLCAPVLEWKWLPRVTFWQDRHKR